MTDSIIQQDRNKLLKLGTFAFYGNIRCNFCAEGKTFFKGNTFKRKCLTSNQTAEFNIFHLRRHIFGSCKLKKLTYQYSHPFVFILNILKPLIVSNLPRKNFCVGIHHRNRCFKLVACVRNKLLLFMVAFFKRIYNLSRKKYRQKEERNKCNSAKNKSIPEQCPRIFI